MSTSNIRKSILAGIAISLGGWGFLSVEGGVLGSILFSLGFLSICILNLNLFTDKICYISNNLRRDYIFWLFIILVCNFLSASLTGFLTTTANPNTYTFATKVASDKLTMTIPQTLLSSILCGIFLYFAVESWKNYQQTAGACMVILCVAGIVLTGCEHCIADIFYFSAANIISKQVMIFIAVTTAGNMVGGILARLLHNPK